MQASEACLTLKVAVEFTSHFVLQFSHDLIRIHAHDFVIRQHPKRSDPRVRLLVSQGNQ